MRPAPPPPPPPPAGPASLAALALAMLLALGLSLALGPAPAAAARPIRQEPHLSVNTSMDHRQMVRAPLAQGEAQMAALLDAAEFEELWAFLPDEGQWVEVGCCERRTPMGNYIGVEAYLLDLMRGHAELAVYHIHYHTRFQKQNYNAAKQRQKVLEEALPSPEDMEAMLTLTRRFRALQPAGRVTWRIVSRHGVTTYGLADPAGSIPEDPDLKPFAFSRIAAEDLAESPEGQASDRALIAQACAELSRPPFAVSFSPR
ncbi:MAG: hypothetical protein V1797_12070 [Pseudomonadota bacterium]